MRTQMTLNRAALASVLVLALFTGCKKQESHSEHDGHDHGTATTEDHAGHDHAKTNSAVANGQ
ncbi:MAG: hypothetical protein JNN01_14030 [Opitutaceae bacterium]|nr:hypothetical protein [Opitutaceae bacterium]